MRRILAIGCAGLLAFTIVTQTASAADLGMPLKAPPVVEAPPPPVCDALCLAGLGVLAAGAIVGGLCLGQVICHHGHAGPVTNGGNDPNSVPAT